MAVLHDGQDFGAIDAELAVALEDGLREVAEDGTGGLLRAAFPGGAGTGLFFGAGCLEAFKIEVDAGVARRIHHEVERQAIGFVEMESGAALQRKGDATPLEPADPNCPLYAQGQNLARVKLTNRGKHFRRSIDGFKHSVVWEQEPEDFIVKLLETDLHYPRELFLFTPYNLCDAAGRLLQFWIGILHLVADGIDHLVHEGLVLPEQSSMPDAAT